MEHNVLADVTTDALEQRLVELESIIAQARARQVVLLREADRRQAPLADGCRSLSEWTAGRLDISSETARILARTTRQLIDQPQLEQHLSDGVMSFDRTVATVALACRGVSEEVVERSFWMDIAGIHRLTARYRKMTSSTERDVFTNRFVAMQPTLDRTSFRLWGQLPAADEETVHQALQTRADAFPDYPNGARPSLGQRHADALTSICMDSLTTSTSGDTNNTGPVLSVFTTAEAAATTDGQAGSTTASGLSVGLATIQEVLCTGSVESILVRDGQPLAQGRTARVIPPKLRRFVLYRDGGCVADGCVSRYRLQPHHRTPWSKGGRTDPDNLITLCWFHHHVVIHQMGYTINPDSPPRRIRFRQPTTGTDPPDR